MINTEKVRLMMKVTQYEKSDGIKEIKMNRYQQSTYVGLQLLKSFVRISIVFVLIAVLVAGYLVLGVVSKGQTAAIGNVFVKYLVCYAGVLGISLLVTWYEGRKEYQLMKEKIEMYEEELRSLGNYFSDEEGEE